MSKKNSLRETEVLESIYEIKVKFKPREFKFDKKQQDLLSLIEDYNSKVIFLSGPAGSSKTYMAVYAALHMMQQASADEQKSIVYIRSVIESASKSIGALPGNIDEKFSPFLLPLEDKLEEMLNYNDIAFLKQKKVIEAIPVNYLRGANWKNKFIIVDEAQNMTQSELTTILSRLGEDSKLVICGDPMQSDIGGKSAFQNMFDLFDDEQSEDNGIFCFEFSDSDIYRSEILKFIVKKLKQM